MTCEERGEEGDGRKSEGRNSSDIITVQVSMVVVMLPTVNILHNFHARIRDGRGWFH